jgi:hypothetical protein
MPSSSSSSSSSSSYSATQYDREDYLARLDTALQDDAQKLQPDDKYRILSRAVVIFSKDRPLTKIKEETGDGIKYDFDLPTDWYEGFSFIVGDIEYPADEYQNPSYLESGDWKFFKKLVDNVTTTYLRMLSFIPASAYKFRYEYATLHILNENTNTINHGDLEAVVALTAALCFWALAAKFAQSTDSTLEADVIDYQRKSDLYTNLAKEQLATYNSLMGIGEEAKGAAAASAGVAIKDLDITYQWAEDMLTHPVRYR